MTKGRMWILAAALLLAPSTAQAQVWWDFIESLSGPGPFQGGGVYLRVGCFTEEQLPPGKGPTVTNRFGVTTTQTVQSSWRWLCWDDTHRNIRQIAEVRYLKAVTADQRPVLAVDQTDTRKVDVHKFDAIAAMRLTPQLDLGAGGGLMHFRFDGRDEHPNERQSTTKLTLIPISITYTPLASLNQPFTITPERSRWKRAFRIRLEVTYIPFGFIPEDWDKGNSVTQTQYATDGNWVLAGGLLIELNALFTTLGRVF